MANRYLSSARFLRIGDVHGKWTIIEVRSPASLCQCTCGFFGFIRNSKMAAKKIAGGCHGCANRRIRLGRRAIKVKMSKSLYAYLGARVRNAIRRCTDQACSIWKYYGGRGIKVYDQWLSTPELFITYLASLPGHTGRNRVLDRIDNDGHYVPGNLRFVSRSTSQRNKGPYRK